MIAILAGNFYLEVSYLLLPLGNEGKVGGQCITGGQSFSRWVVHQAGFSSTDLIRTSIYRFFQRVCFDNTRL